MPNKKYRSKLWLYHITSLFDTFGEINKLEIKNRFDIIVKKYTYRPKPLSLLGFIRQAQRAITAKNRPEIVTKLVTLVKV
jgi:hypothetical protein